MMHDRFQQDRLEILGRNVAASGIGRRRLMQGAGLLLGGLALPAWSHRAFAQARQLVFVNWGGDASDAYDKAYGQPFQKETGIPVKQDGTGPTEGAIEAQAKSGSPTWDIVDADPFSAITLGNKGLMEPIDYAVVDKTKMRPGFGWDYAASTYFYSYVIAYDSEKYGDKVPTGMADFFDVAKFPGKRTMYKWGAAMWEAALLADGVPADKLYPLDLDRAHAKIAAFKDNVVSFWGGGSESQSVMLNGEASMGIVWHTRATLMEKDTGGKIKFVWDQGLLFPGAMAVLKNNPGGKEAAMKFIASAQDPQRQLIMFQMLGQGPANPATDALIPAEERRNNPVDPENIKKQIACDMEWYAEHYSAALDAYTKVISA